MNDYDLTAADIITLDLIRHHRWCPAANIPHDTRHLETAGYITNNGWLTLTSAGWDLYEVEATA